MGENKLQIAPKKNHDLLANMRASSSIEAADSGGNFQNNKVIVDFLLLRVL